MLLPCARPPRTELSFYGFEGDVTARVEARCTQGVVDIARSALLNRKTVGLELLAGWCW